MRSDGYLVEMTGSSMVSPMAVSMADCSASRTELILAVQSVGKTEDQMVYLMVEQKVGYSAFPWDQDSAAH
jgi:hypothetical protein